MKCESCGKAMSLEDLRCPACGNINPHAQKHIKDMKRYEGEFQDTKREVYAATKKYSQVSCRATVIVVLLILCIVASFILRNGYDIVRDIEEKKSIKNKEEYSIIIDHYLEQEDYLALCQFVTDKKLDYYDTEKEYENYMPVIRASRAYARLVSGLLRCAFPDSNYNEDAQSIGDKLEYYCCCIDPEGYSYYEIDWDKCKPALEGMEKHINAMLMTYCHLTEEDLEGFYDLTEARRTVLIEERMGDVKEAME